MQTRRSDHLPLPHRSGTASNRCSTSRLKTTRTLTRTTRMTKRRMFPTTTTTRTRARTATLRRKESRACPSYSPASRLGQGGWRCGLPRQRVDRALDARVFNHDACFERILVEPSSHGRSSRDEKRAWERGDGPGRGRYGPTPLDFRLGRDSDYSMYTRAALHSIYKSRSARGEISVPRPEHGAERILLLAPNRPPTRA